MVPWLTGLQKTYETTLRFGWTSTTEDTEGELTETGGILPTQEALEAILPNFTGQVTQRPPRHSAIRVEGRRAYKIARGGREVEMPERTVQIDELTLLDCQKNAQDAVTEARLRVVCGSGTYIRALGRDIGAALGSGAYLTALRRTRVGNYGIEDSVPMHKERGIDTAEAIAPHLIDVGRIQIDLPTLTLDPHSSTRFLQGQRLAGRTESPIEKLAVRNPEGILLGIGAIREDVLHPLVVLG